MTTRIDDDLKACLLESRPSIRRKYARQLASNGLTKEAYNRLACCYKYTFGEANHMNKVAPDTMRKAHAYLGAVLAEVVCTHGQEEGLNIRLKVFIDRIYAHHNIKLKYTQMRAYVLAALRLLAVYGVLREAANRKKCDVQYDGGILSNVLCMFGVGSRDWQNKNLVNERYKAVEASSLTATLQAMTAEELRIATNGKVKMSALHPPPPPPATEPSPEKGLEHSIVGLAGEVIKLKVKHEKLQSAHEQLRREHDLLTNLVNSICERLLGKA
tara:strand:+ start:745 stop:1557 length:813 start_codon:yes stop_codon:yes gene_type:complete